MDKRKLPGLAFKALKEAVRDAIKEHRRADLPLVVWQDEKIMLVKPWKKKYKAHAVTK